MAAMSIEKAFLRRFFLDEIPIKKGEKTTK
jgi:hypothetical protein